MRSIKLPWVRLAVFTLLLAILAWWLFLRDDGAGSGKEAPDAGPAEVTEEQSVVVLDILVHEVGEGEHPTYWMRLEGYGWDVEIPRDDATEAEKAAAAERRKLAFADLLQELRAARQIEGEEEIKGIVRSAANVPMNLTMQAFGAFIEAGFGAVEMETGSGSPPGPVGER